MPGDALLPVQHRLVSFSIFFGGHAAITVVNDTRDQVGSH